MLNQVVLIGRLTRDPQLRYTTNGIPVTSFIVAVSRYRRNAAGERITDFIPCVAFRQQAEFIGQFGRKGALVSIEGSLHTRRRVMPDGQQRLIVEVRAWRVQLLERRPIPTEVTQSQEIVPIEGDIPPIEEETPMELPDLEEPLEDFGDEDQLPI